MVIHDSVFEETDISKGPNVLIIGCFGPGFISTHDPRRVISFGVIGPHYSQADAHKSNLRERGLRFFTVPGSGKEVIVTHKQSLDQLFEFPGLRRGEILPGGMYKFEMSLGRLQPQWSCWGDFEGDLKGKNLHAWAKGGNYLGDDEPPRKRFKRVIMY